MQIVNFLLYPSDEWICQEVAFRYFEFRATVFDGNLFLGIWSVSGKRTSGKYVSGKWTVPRLLEQQIPSLTETVYDLKTNGIASLNIISQFCELVLYNFRVFSIRIPTFKSFPTLLKGIYQHVDTLM